MARVSPSPSGPQGRAGSRAAGVAGQGGAYAEVVVADARLLARRPRSLTAREAAALPLVGITALEGLKRAGVASGPLIDPSTFTLETLGAAHEHAESGAAVGKVVIDIANGA